MSTVLPPPEAAVLAEWADRVRADREQVERCREVEDPADFYAPLVDRFRHDPHRRDDPTSDALLSHAHAEETWLDVGAGAGRFAVPLAMRVEEVIAVEPSAAMVEGLRAGIREQRLSNVRIVEQRWPLADPPRADVSLLAHLGYDLAEIGPFLDAMERASGRLCLAVMGQSAMTTVATLFWEEIHGEPRVRLPALPELLVLLLARGRLPEVKLVERPPAVFSSRDEALAMARRQLWLKEGSAKDDRLRALLPDRLHDVEGGWTFDRQRSSIGVVSWQPAL